MTKAGSYLRIENHALHTHLPRCSPLVTTAKTNRDSRPAIAKTSSTLHSCSSLKTKQTPTPPELHFYQTINNTYPNIIMSQHSLVWSSDLDEATRDSLTSEGTQMLERLEKLEIDDSGQQVRNQCWQKEARTDTFLKVSELPQDPPAPSLVP